MMLNSWGASDNIVQISSVQKSWYDINEISLFSQTFIIVVVDDLAMYRRRPSAATIIME